MIEPCHDIDQAVEKAKSAVYFSLLMSKNFEIETLVRYTCEYNVSFLHAGED